ncbi:MAG: type Z 30S ribosomal protein S14 [bacterium]
MAKKSMVVKNLRKKTKKIQHVNRCGICSRPRGYIRFFGICRICFRNLAGEGYLPGVTKSSW